MMYYRKMFFVMFSFLLVLSAFAGCKKDSDDDNPAAPSSFTLVGNWNLSKVTVTPATNIQTVFSPEQLGLSINLVFNSNNTSVMTVTDSTGTSVERGTYTYANNTLTLRDSTGTSLQFPLEFHTNDMFIMQALLDIDGTTTNSSMEFTRQKTIRWE